MTYQFETTVTAEVCNIIERSGDKSPANVYRAMVDQLEKPMLMQMMKYTFGNQSACAVMLGLNRATLRTKLKRHNLL
jgi:Fis family transcriptional regulator